MHIRWIFLSLLAWQALQLPLQASGQASGQAAGRETRPEKLLGLLALEGHETVLDINCGDRSVVSALEKRLPKGHVISSDPQLLLSLEQDVAAVTCFHCFQWLVQPGHVLMQIEKSLQPAGKCLLVAIPQESEELQILQLALRDPRSHLSHLGNTSQSVSWSIDDYRHGMWNLGFDILHFEVMRGVKAYHTHEELQDTARGWAERLHLYGLSSDFPDVFAEYAYQHYQDSYSCAVIIPFRTLIVLGAKQS